MEEKDGEKWWLDTATCSMSIGMVPIAAVQAMHPQLFICDEPPSNLDIRLRRGWIQFLQAAAQTMLIASNDLEFV